MKTSSQDILITKNGLYTNDNQQENDINTVTAETADSNIKNLNDPNLMSVIEKQTAVSQFYGLTSQYNVLVQNAKDDGIDTTAVTTAYNNLNRFMADILADPDHASDIDRVAYKKYQDAYNQELANIQNALQNNANSKFASAASAASSAAIATSQAFSAADSAYNYANSEIAVQSTATAKAQSVADNAFNQAKTVGSQASSAISVQSAATAKAQSSADNAFNQAQAIGSQASSAVAVQSAATAKAQRTADSAFSQAKTAIDNGKVTSQAVTNLKDGSTLTIAQLGNGLASKVSNSEYATYKTQTANQIGQLVTNSAFSAYQQTTADLISSKVATKDFSAYQDTTAKVISSKVESSDFNTYKTQTADEISSKVSTVDFNNLTISNRNLALGTATATKMTGKNIVNQSQGGYGFPKAIKKGTMITVSFDVSSTTGVGSFKVQFNGNDQGASWQFIYGSNLVNGTKHATTTIAVNADQSHVYFRLDNATGDVTFSNFIISESSKEVSWSPAPEEQATQSQITQLSGQIDQKVNSGDFSSYKTQTDRLIGSKVANGDFSTYKTQTDNLIGSKVDNGDYQSYKTQTADLIGSKVANNDFSSYKTQTDKLIGSKVANSDFSSYRTQTADLIASKVATKDFNTYTSQTATAITSKVATKDFDSYKTQTANDINLRVKEGDLISQINIEARHTLISSSGQLTLSGKNINFDTTNPVIIPSANIDSLLVGKKLTAADIAANTFSTNNGTFTVDKNGAITAKDMTLIGGTLTSPTINGSTINGTTINTPNLNLGDNGQITGSYSVHDDIGWFQPINGTGSLKIDNGYIQSTAHIVYYNKILNGIGGDKWGHWESSTQFVPAPDQAHPDISNIAESTLTPAFLKLDIFNADKSKVNSRAYIDGTGLYINDGTTQAISSMLSDYELLSSGMAYLNGGIQIKKGTTFTFGNLGMNGYHSIFMLDGRPLNFTDGLPSNNPVEIRAKTFTKASRLSIKHDIKPLSTAESSRLLNAIDIEKFRYTHDGATYKYQYGGVIDDVNSLGSKQYSMPPELLSEDGTGINLDSLTGILVKRVQDQDKTIAELSMRLTKLEMEK